MARMNSLTRVALFLLSPLSLSYSTQKQSHSLLYSNPNLGLPLSPSLCLYSIETQSLFRSSKQEQNQPTHRQRWRASCVFRRPFFALTCCTVTQALDPQISSTDNQGVTCQWLIPPLVQATMVACSKIEVANVAKKRPFRYQTQKNPRRLYFQVWGWQVQLLCMVDAYYPTRQCIKYPMEA